MPHPTASSGTRPARLTAVYHKHLVLGARIEARDSWLVPIAYPAPARESQAIQHGIGLLDIGDTGKIDVKSDDLDAVLAAMRLPSPLPINSTVLVGESLRICRMTASQALLLTPPAAFQEIFERVRGIADMADHTHVVDLTGALCALRLLGPKAPLLLERLSAVDLAPDRFANGALAQCGLARVHAIVLRRDAATGTRGYDLFVDRDFGAYLWDTLLEAGAPLGIAPVGRGAEGDTR